MGTGTEAKTQRNERLAIDYLAKGEDGVYKFSLEELVAKYEISKTRILIILGNMGIKAQRGGIKYYNEKIRGDK
jgi:hypothetical protein